MASDPTHETSRVQGCSRTLQGVRAAWAAGRAVCIHRAAARGSRDLQGAAGWGVSPEHPPKNYGRPKQHATPPEFSRIFHWQRTQVTLSASISTQNMPVQPSVMPGKQECSGMFLLSCLPKPKCIKSGKHTCTHTHTHARTQVEANKREELTLNETPSSLALGTFVSDQRTFSLRPL